MKRNTIQRTLTLNAVRKLHNHPSAEEVYEEVASEHPSISRGTIYRNLNQLSEDGEIRLLRVPDGADRFDHSPDQHYHVRCIRCGRVFDVDMDYIPDLEASIRDHHGFQFIGHDLMFRGICPDCSAADDDGETEREG